MELTEDMSGNPYEVLNNNNYNNYDNNNDN